MKHKNLYYEEYNAADSIKKAEMSLIIKENDSQHSKLERSVEILESYFGVRGRYRLNNVIDTVIKKIEFADKFNFETVS